MIPTQLNMYRTTSGLPGFKGDPLSSVISRSCLPWQVHHDIPAEHTLDGQIIPPRMRQPPVFELRILASGAAELDFQLWLDKCRCQNQSLTLAAFMLPVQLL